MSHTAIANFTEQLSRIEGGETVVMESKIRLYQVELDVLILSRCGRVQVDDTCGGARRATERRLSLYGYSQTSARLDYLLLFQGRYESANYLEVRVLGRRGAWKRMLCAV